MRSLEKLELACKEQFRITDPALSTGAREKKAFCKAFRMLHDEMERTERIAALRHVLMGGTFHGLGELQIFPRVSAESRIPAGTTSFTEAY
jgi:hypothetical protein